MILTEGNFYIFKYRKSLDGVGVEYNYNATSISLEEEKYNLIF